MNRRGCPWKWLALCVVISIVALGTANAGLFGLGKGKKQSRKAPRYSLVVFPFDNGTDTTVPDSYGGYVAADVRTMLTGKSEYIPYLYTDRLPSIRGPRNEQSLKAQDIDPPFADDKSKPLKIAQVIGSDYYLVGSIEEITVDTAKKVATVTLKADVFNTKNGRLVRTCLVSGHTPETVKTSEAEDLRDIAKGAAVTRLIAEITADESSAGAAPAACG